MERTEHTIDDTDTEKRVLDTEGNRLGRVERVEDGVARVEPTTDATVTTIARAVNLTRERRFGFSEASVERVTEHDVVLKD